MMLSRERKSVVDVIIIYPPAAAFRYPAPRPYVDLFLLKIQGDYMIGVDIPQAFFSIKTAGSNRDVTTAGNGKQFPYFRPVNMTVEMNDSITLHQGAIIFVFVLSQPVDRVMGKQNHQFFLRDIPWLALEIGFMELVGTHADFAVFAEFFEAKQSRIKSDDAHGKILQFP